MSELSSIRKELADGRPVMTFTKGVSMQPLLREGMTGVVLRPVEKPLKIGDLPICTLPDGRYIIHRIIKIQGDFIRTRGDNCLGSEQFTAAHVIGIVTEIQRKGKTISVEDKGYRLYVRFWMLIYPLRRMYYLLRGKLRPRHKK